MGFYEGMFISKKMDLSQMVISDVSLGVENADGARVVFAFMQSGKWCDIEGIALATQSLTFDSLLAEGTSYKAVTREKISAMVSEPGFQFAVAMQSVNTPTPSVTFGIYTKQHLIELEKVVESPEYCLDGEIIKRDYDCSLNTTLEANGYKNGRWLGWGNIYALDNDCEKVKFRATCKLDNVGELAEFNSAMICTRPGTYKVLSESGNIYLDNSHEDISLCLIGNGQGTTQVYYCPKPTQTEQVVAFKGASGEQAIKLSDAADFASIKAVNTAGSISYTYDTAKKEVYVNSATDGSITYKEGTVEEVWKPMHTDNGVIWFDGDGKIKIELTADPTTVNKTYEKAGAYPLDAIEVTGAEYANGVVAIPEDNTTITYTRAVKRPEVRGVILERK